MNRGSRLAWAVAVAFIVIAPLPTLEGAGGSAVFLTGAGSDHACPMGNSLPVACGSTLAAIPHARSRGSEAARFTPGLEVGRTSTPESFSVTAIPTPARGDAPLDVAFQATVVGGTPPFNFSWSFGDGYFGLTNPTSHIYPAGHFTANVSVNDSVGNHATASMTVSVDPELTVSFVAGSFGACEGPFTIDFSSSVSGGQTPYSYFWNFGDGNTSTAPNPSHTYANGSAQLVSLNVTDATGRHAPAEQPIAAAACAGLSSSSTLVLGVAVTTLSAAGALLTWFAWRRRRPPPPPVEIPESSPPPTLPENSSGTGPK